MLWWGLDVADVVTDFEFEVLLWLGVEEATVEDLTIAGLLTLLRIFSSREDVFRIFSEHVRVTPW